MSVIAKMTGAAAMALSLAACVTMGSSDAPATIPSGPCNADGVQSLIGQTATAEMGTRLRVESGAATLRWAPPRSAMTMDFRPDRLTVGYDDDYRITTISCG